MTTETAHIYLIPGFFGFTNLGKVRYFEHVARHLRTAMRDNGVLATIHQVPTLPTASLPTRSTKLFDAISATAGEEDTPIHLIGHSSGGLDLRLLLSTEGPTSLPSTYLNRVRSAITVACPHYGTPLAGFFSNVFGKQLLKLLSATTLHTIRMGIAPMQALTLLAETFVKSATGTRLSGDALERIVNELVSDFGDEKPEEITDFLSEIENDQSLLMQLAPESMQLFRSAAKGSGSIRCGSVITRARPPGMRGMLEMGLSPGAQVSYGLYRALHSVTSEMMSKHLPPLNTEDEKMLRHAFGDAPGSQSNDAIVPTLSQLWCHPIHATWADHLDVIGHFDGPHRNPVHFDWLHTASGFQQRQFEETWNRVTSFALGTDHQ